MSPRIPVSEVVYDAALRTIARDELPDDGQVLEQWYGAREPKRAHREIALEVMQVVADHGDGRRCVD